MSIRLWLMVADCWRCGSSIELSQEQEREALRLLREREESRRTETREAAAAIVPTVARKPAPQPKAPPPVAKKEPAAEPATDVKAPPAKPPAAPAPERPAAAARRPRRVAASQVHHGARARVRDIYEKGAVGVFWSDLFRDLPAWLVSLVVHLVAMLLLGLWVDRPAEDPRTITLATSVGYQDLEGDIGDPERPTVEAFEFDDPGAIDLESLKEVVEAVSQEEPVLKENLAIDVPDPIGNMPNIASQSLVTLPPAPVGRMFAGRDPEIRAQMVEKAGGSSFTEVAVARGLKFISRHQNEDGSWSLHAFHKAPGCDGTCTGAGNVNSDMAGTALALLPFLGAGQTHLEGQYTDEVFRGLKWIIEKQGENGDLRGKGNGQMYAHGQAAIVLCEAYALTGDEQLRAPAQLALDFIVRAQHPRGGWRYQPRQPGDTSVIGWQLMALRSGKMSYLFVPKKTLDLAGLFLDRVQRDKAGGRYAYMPGRGPTEVMTAEALLCRQYLGWPKDHPGLKSGIKYLLERHPPKKNKPNIYYWYYATQVMHHYGGDAWNEWNAKMREVLADTQEKKGHQAGSWEPRGGHASRGGRLYMTSLAVCTLEVYYRHLPLYSSELPGD